MRGEFIVTLTSDHQEACCSAGCQREAEADARRQTCCTSDAELEERVGEYVPRHGVWPI